MIMFWILVALLLLAGTSFFLPPLFGRTQGGTRSRSDWNLLIHRQRREELAAETLDGRQTALLTAELDRDLLSDLDLSERVPTRPWSSGRSLLGLGLVASLIIGVLLYLQFGRLDLLDTPIATAGSPSRASDIEAGIQQLTEKLAKNPNDLEGWFLLGRSLQATGKLDKAVTAYEFALKLAPENPDLKALYAQVLAETHGGSLEGKPTQIIDDILRNDPNHPTALWLAGLAAAERRDVTKALEHWLKLKAQLPADSEDAEQISRYIAQLQGPPPQSERPPARGGASIRVTVTLSDTFKERAAPEDTVFIFAKAAAGPPMPLAILRKQVKDLPVEVTLDDSLSMMESMKISSFDRIVIGARVSKTGQAIPTPGDLQGLTEPFAVGPNISRSVKIDQMVR